MRVLLALVTALTFATSAWGVPVPHFEDGWDGPGLGSANLTYYFGPPTSDFTIEAQRGILVAALGVWSSVAAVSFTETPLANQPRSIEFNFCFVSTCFPQPNPSNVLAVALLPPPAGPEPRAGDIWFNDGFQWNNGADLLLWVAIHESGHSLGLLHSDNPNSVMFGNASSVFNGLTQDDIDGIRLLYAPAAIPEPATLFLFGTTAVGLGMAWRKRRRGLPPAV
jgi:hypothetical protein